MALECIKLQDLASRVADCFNGAGNITKRRGSGIKVFEMMLKVKQNFE